MGGWVGWSKTHSQKDGSHALQGSYDDVSLRRNKHRPTAARVLLPVLGESGLDLQEESATYILPHVTLTCLGLPSQR